MSKTSRNFWRQSRCAVHQIAMLVFEPTLRRSCCWTIWAEVAASCFHGFSELQNKVDLFGLTGMRSWPNLVAWLVWHMAENIGWENAATDTGDLRSLLAWLPPSSCWCWPIVQETIEASLRNERGKKKEEVHKTLFSGVCTSLAKEAYMMNVNDPCSGGCTSLVRTGHWWIMKTCQWLLRAPPWSWSGGVIMKTCEWNPCSGRCTSLARTGNLNSLWKHW